MKQNRVPSEKRGAGIHDEVMHSRTRGRIGLERRRNRRIGLWVQQSTY
jgi:hypothetical protein